jgi:hypothetical protein
MRFFVRRGPIGWMVWDRDLSAPARMMNGRIAAKLSEDDARLICTMYSSQIGDSEDGETPTLREG